ncbi:MAG: O-antigen ligase family protein [Kiritimatiellae bacterium]|nr:O-antigen ligase family protein [Kiritimatiellia bacterium]
MSDGEAMAEGKRRHDPLSTWAFRCLLWYVCIMFMAPQNRFPVLWPLHIADLSFGGAMLLHVLSCLRTHQPMIRPGGATGLGIAVMGWAAVANTIGPFQSGWVWNTEIEIIYKNIGLLILMESMCDTRQRCWSAMMTMLFCSIYWLKAGIRLASAGATYSGDRLMGAAIGMIDNPNGMAYMLSLMLPLYLYVFQAAKGKNERLLFLAGVVANLFVVLKTGSRTGLVTLLVMLIWILKKNVRHHPLGLVGAGMACCFLLPLTGEQNVQRFKTIPQSAMSFLGFHVERHEGPLSQDEQSAEERSAKNRDTWKLIKAYPLSGVGMHPNQRYLSRYPMAGGQVHCEILMAGKQMGFPGMLLYLAVLTQIWLCGRMIRLRYAGWPGISDLGWTYQLQAIGILVGGSFCPGAWHVPMMIMAATASSLHKMSFSQFEIGREKQ